MPYRLKTDVLYKAAAALGDTTDVAIRERTGIAAGTFSRLVNRQVEPGLPQLDILSTTYGLPVKDLYEDVNAAPAEAVA